MDELLQQVAEQRGMPASLVERSAKAKAEKSGTSVEAVLREWLGESPADTPPAADEPVAAPEPAAAAPPTPATATESAEVSVDRLVQLAADAKRMPPKLILSSAQARAKHGNTSLEAVLAEWAGADLEELETRTAGGGAPTVTDQPAPAAAPQREEQEEAAPAAAAGAAVAMSMDELLAKVAEVKGMPEALAKRSAEARARKTGEPVEAVLAEWAGVELGAPSEASGEPPSAPAQAPTTPPAPAAAAAGAAVAMSMDELLAKVAEVKGMPEALAKRSAEARARKTGEPVEAVLAEWAGVDVSAVTAAPDASPAPAAGTTAPTVPVGQTEDDADTGIEVIEATEPEVGAADEFDDAASRRMSYPVWLAAAFVLIPLLAVAYILVSPNGPDCGSAGNLQVDPVTGEAVNCDGSEYGVNTVDHFAEGGAVFTQCAACHGDAGQGGAGPAMAGGAVLETFPAGSCSDHIEWVTLGTAGWPDPTYGAQGKPVGGVGLMPTFGGELSEDQIAQVVLYERVAFGGEDLAEAEADCGLTDQSEGDSVEASGG